MNRTSKKRGTSGLIKDKKLLLTFTDVKNPYSKKKLKCIWTSINGGMRKFIYSGKQDERSGLYIWDEVEEKDETTSKENKV